MPGVHGKQYALPVSICSYPKVHRSHEASSATPTSAEYRPIPHNLQASAEEAASVEDHVPLPQFLHLESLSLPSSFEYFPGTQALQ